MIWLFHFKTTSNVKNKLTTVTQPPRNPPFLPKAGSPVHEQGWVEVLLALVY